VSHKHSPNTERAAECQRLVDELRPFYEDELNDWEKTFVTDMDERLTKHGEGTYVSDSQHEKLSEIYHRVIG
jgi:hypothetical protein